MNQFSQPSQPSQPSGTPSQPSGTPSQPSRKPSKPSRQRGSRFDPWQLLLALFVVAAVGSTLWLWGRPKPNEPEVAVIVTSEHWFSGAAPAGFQQVYLPADLAERFTKPADLIGQVAAVDIPPGVYVARSQLVEDFADERDAEFTQLDFAADYSAWPEQHRSAGDWAVIATTKGGCALHVLRLAGMSDSLAELRVDQQLAKELFDVTEHRPLVLWESPSAGWPACRGGIVAPAPPPVQPTQSTSTQLTHAADSHR